MNFANYVIQLLPKVRILQTNLAEQDKGEHQVFKGSKCGLVVYFIASLYYIKVHEETIGFPYVYYISQRSNETKNDSFSYAFCQNIYRKLPLQLNFKNLQLIVIGNTKL